MIKILFVFFLLAVTLTGCQPANSRHTADVRQQPAEPPNLSNEIQDRALLLAGMAVSGEYSERPEIQALLNHPFYRAHARKMNDFWHSVEVQRINKIVPWRQKHIGANVKNRTALYPLSGGDFLNLHLMYPQADRYVMLAMEKPGQMPDPTDLTEEQLRGSLLSLQHMLGNIVRTGYFFSRLMNQHMNPEKYGIYGTMPTVAIFLVRLGHSLESIGRTCVNDAGELVEKVDSPCRLSGYRIRFRERTTGLHKEVIYISARIDNSLFSPEKPEGRFFRGLGRTAVMMKAAVYLLHSSNYRQAAQYFLDQADVIIQDDSGLPYRYFDPNVWHTELYGVYVGPPRLAGTGYYPQPDLRKAFLKADGPLPFEFGYGQVSASKKSGLILAYRK